jgi:hypothetical protein
MFLVLASRFDDASRALVKAWAEHDARLLTPADLSISGWRHDPAARRSIAVVDGGEVDAEEIDGVLTRLPSVLEHELAAVVPGERSYAAAEMTAFLTHWLATLPCPVLNRPTATSLSGPYWRRERWIHVAARAGIPVARYRRSVDLSASSALEPEGGGVDVTVIGQQWFGPEEVLARQVRRLADLAGVDLLAARFSSPEPDARLLDATPWPDLTVDGTREAVLAYLVEGPGAG